MPGWNRTTAMVVAALAGPCASAGDPVQTNAPSATTGSHTTARGPPALEEWHDYWSSTIDRRVAYFDHFFGDERLKEEAKGTRIALRLGVRASRKDDVELEQEFDVRLALPQLERRFQILVDSAVKVDEPDEAQAIEDAAREARPDTGVRYVFFEDEKLRFNTDAGARLGSNPQAFGRIRGRYTVPFNLWEMLLAQRLEWFTVDGFKETSELTWSRRLPHKALFRSRSTVTWEEQDRGYEPRQSFAYFKTIDERRSWRATLRGTWPETPYGGKAIYGLEFTGRHLLHSDWLFGEVTPGFEYLEEDDYLFNPFVTLVFEVVFEKDRRGGE